MPLTPDEIEELITKYGDVQYREQTSNDNSYDYRINEQVLEQTIKLYATIDDLLIEARRTNRWPATISHSRVPDHDVRQLLARQYSFARWEVIDTGYELQFTPR